MDDSVRPLHVLCWACFVAAGLFWWQGTRGIDLWDEGFLWYGVQRVLHGEVPIRDFMAYDPGRYYVAAALMAAWGDHGVVALRGTEAAFQAVGLFIGLLLVARSGKERSLVYMAASTATLLVWMYPRAKAFDVTQSLVLIGALTCLVERATSRRYFLVGLCVGMVAVFGRNHGLYGAVGSLGAMAWLGLRREGGPGWVAGGALWIAGVTIGFGPILLMALLVPGFAGAYVESIRFLFELGATNLPLPVPWPWRVPLGSMPVYAGICGVLLGLFFLGALVFAVASISWVVARRLRGRPVPPALAAASFLALPYVHYAYSRADACHLAQGIFPLLTGCLVALSAQRATVKWPLALGLCGASLSLMVVQHPGWQLRTEARGVRIEVSGSSILVDRGTAADVALLRSLAGRYAPEGRGFLASPFWPGAYALLERRSPVWEIYALFPRPPSFERAEIERLRAARPGFVLILDHPLDGREELRLRNTHPLLWAYLTDDFERRFESSNPALQIFTPREDAR